MSDFPIVVVQMLVHGEPFEEIDAMMRSLERVSYPRERWRLIIINNVKHGHDVADRIRTAWLPKSGATLPEIVFEEQRPNLGFAGGHARAFQISASFNPKYIYLLNQDAEVHPNFLSESVAYMNWNPKVAVAQSRVMLLPDTGLVNSRGNAMHFLGFGFSLGYKERYPKKDGTDGGLPAFYASGAAVIVRKTAIDAIGGLFDPKYFLYHEDTDLSWRARLAGYEIGYAEKSAVYHRYEFSKSIQKFYWMERNRHVTNFSCYKWKTILLLFPASAVMELGTLFFAFKSGWGKEKIGSLFFLMRPSTWKWIRERRKLITDFRKTKDAAHLRDMVGVIVNQEVDNPILARFVNPAMSAYLRAVKFIARW
ncbi:MAG: glycosyltransferase family 2 protein [Patescibacteria group bacterium]